MKMKTRILLLSAVEHQSGSALRFRGLAGALVRRGFETHYLEFDFNRVKTEGNEIQVLVTDRAGNPITDLSLDEIRVTEGGDDRKVAFVEPFATGSRPCHAGQPRSRLQTRSNVPL